MSSAPCFITRVIRRYNHRRVEKNDIPVRERERANIAKRGNTAKMLRNGFQSLNTHGRMFLSGTDPPCVNLNTIRDTRRQAIRLMFDRAELVRSEMLTRRLAAHVNMQHPHVNCFREAIKTS